jgi:lysyl-tRNA synthetase class 2
MSEQEHNPSQNTNQIIEERRAKLAALREAGVAFPNDFRRNNLASDLHKNYDNQSNETLEKDSVSVEVAGRMILKRVMGKASFATIQDMSGHIQLYITNDITGESVHARFKHFDLGDILGVHGTLFITKSGELTVRVKSLRLLTKSLLTRKISWPD